VGEEVVSPGHHILAIGIKNTIRWKQSATSVIDQVHRLGGVAIAAHPVSVYWPGFDAEAMGKLDGAEVLHPVAYTRDGAHRQLQEFYARGRFTAIGDSDFHGLGPMGLCRTFVFVREDSEPAILEALRTGHTVVFDRDGRAYGDLELIHLAAQDRRLEEFRSPALNQGELVAMSRVCGILGLLGIFLFGYNRSLVR
jgi:hypothetical protein